MTNTIPTVTRTWTCVLFDLDGTITDSAPGIVRALAKTFLELGMPVPSPTDLVSYVGPPMLDSFRDRAGMGPEQSWDALLAYRANYDHDGAYDSAIYPGIAGVLKSLKAASIPLAIATSKPERLSRAILQHLGLVDYFDVVSGASEDETISAKPQVVAEALRRLDEQGVDLSQTVMVGDRGYDVEGAHENGVPTILVEWGYGSPAEAGGAIAIVHSTDQLRSLLLG